MKIGFLLCSPDISGGTNVILEHGSGLQGLGHEVCIITQQKTAADAYAWHPTGDQLDWVTFEEAQSEVFDCLIATWWESPYLLNLFDSSHYVYFVQSIESRFFQDEDPQNLDLRNHKTGASKCEHSYYFSLPVITEATWIKQYLEKNCNQRPYLVRNGIRKELYTGNSVVQEKPVDGLRVLVEGPVDVFHKNVPRTIALCRTAGVREVWLLTSSEQQAFEGVDRVFSRVPLEQTPSIYRSCHLLVKLSHVEGMFGPPLEMFHCGGTAIVYEVTGHDEYIQHGVNGLIAPRDDEQRVIEYLKTLGSDRALLHRLCEGAEQTAMKWPDWAESTAEFNKALTDITADTPVSRQYLENVSRIFNTHQALQLDSRELSLYAAREASAEPDDQHNFIQLYAVSGEKIIDQSWSYYTAGRKVLVAGEITVPAPDCQIRLDPSVRIGMISLYGITIKDHKGDEIATYLPANFDRLFLIGTARWLKKNEDHWVILSYGNDPQIFLPPLDVVSGHELSIQISLCEMGIGQYVAELESRASHDSENKGLLFRLRKILGL